MHERISALLGLIQEETRICRELLDHARQAAAALRRGGPGRVLENGRLQEACGARLRLLQTRLASVCRDAGRGLGIPDEGVTMEKIAGRLETETAAEVRARAALLGSLVAELQSLNRKNRRLAERSSCHSRGLVALVANATGAYRPSGSLEPAPAAFPTFSRRG